MRPYREHVLIKTPLVVVYICLLSVVVAPPETPAQSAGPAERLPVQFMDSQDNIVPIVIPRELNSRAGRELLHGEGTAEPTLYDYDHRIASYLEALHGATRLAEPLAPALAYTRRTLQAADTDPDSTDAIISALSQAAAAAAIPLAPAGSAISNALREAFTAASQALAGTESESPLAATLQTLAQASPTAGIDDLAAGALAWSVLTAERAYQRLVAIEYLAWHVRSQNRPFDPALFEALETASEQYREARIVLERAVTQTATEPGRDKPELTVSEHLVHQAGSAEPSVLRWILPAPQMSRTRETTPRIAAQNAGTVATVLDLVSRRDRQSAQTSVEPLFEEIAWMAELSYLAEMETAYGEPGSEVGRLLPSGSLGEALDNLRRLTQTLQANPPGGVTPASVHPAVAARLTPTGTVHGTVFAVGKDAALRWETVPPARHYEVELSTDPTFSTLVGSTRATGSGEWTLPVANEPGTYYWRVRGSQDDAAAWSGWSNANRIHLVAHAPGDGAPVYATNAVLRWTMLPGAERYGVRIVDPLSDDGSHQGEATNARYHVTEALAAGRTYHWRLRALTGGEWSQWSDPFEIHAVEREPIADTLHLVGGQINGQELSAVDREVVVPSGAPVEGQLVVEPVQRVASLRRPALVVGVTWNNAGIYDRTEIPVGADAWPYEIDLAARAPRAPGTYHIVIAYGDDAETGLSEALACVHGDEERAGSCNAAPLHQAAALGFVELPRVPAVDSPAVYLAATSVTVTVTAEQPDETLAEFPRTVITDSFQGARSVDVADLTGNGVPDIIAAASLDDEIAWWEHTEQGYRKHVLDDSFAGAFSVHAVDLDQDGSVDIVAAADREANLVWWRQVDGAFVKHVIPGEAAGVTSVTSADITGNGRPDLVAALRDANQIAWWEQTAPGRFSRHVIADEFYGAFAVDVADIDGDGQPDVVGVAFHGDELAWWRQNDGVFSRHVIDADVRGAGSVRAVDVDGDGRVDIVAAANRGREIAWWRQEQDGSFTKHVIDDAFDGASSVTAADLNNDGRLDIIATSWTTGRIAWWEQREEGGFRKHLIAEGFDHAHSVITADMTGDDSPDVLAVAASPGQIALWRNPFGTGQPAARNAAERAVAALRSHALQRVFGPFHDGWYELQAVLSGPVPGSPPDRSQPSSPPGARLNEQPVDTVLLDLMDGTRYRVSRSIENVSGPVEGLRVTDPDGALVTDEQTLFRVLHANELRDEMETWNIVGLQTHLTALADGLDELLGRVDWPQVRETGISVLSRIRALDPASGADTFLTDGPTAEEVLAKVQALVVGLETERWAQRCRDSAALLAISSPSGLTESQRNHVFYTVEHFSANAHTLSSLSDLVRQVFGSGAGATLADAAQRAGEHTPVNRPSSRLSPAQPPMRREYSYTEHLLAPDPHTAPGTASVQSSAYAVLALLEELPVADYWSALGTTQGTSVVRTLKRVRDHQSAF